MYKSSIQFGTSTPIGKEEQKKLQSIVQNIMENADSTEFRQPVDYKKLQLNDYPMIIKNPMDLGSVKKKLQGGKYQKVEECLDEIQLIWENCKSYNAEGSWIYRLAEKMEKYFKKLVKNYMPTLSMQIQSKKSKDPMQIHGGNQNNKDEIYEEEEPETLTFAEKNKFSQRMKYLSQERLGMVVHLIQNNCPVAYKDIDKEKCQILVDNIDIDTFKKLNEQIDNWMNEENQSSQNKK